MDNSKNKILDLKLNILIDAISAIHIRNVDIKNPDENNVMLYISTDKLSDVNTENLQEICDKYSKEGVLVSYQIPTGKFINGKEVDNTDTVCIFIEK